MQDINSQLPENKVRIAR